MQGNEHAERKPSTKFISQTNMRDRTKTNVPWTWSHVCVAKRAGQKLCFAVIKHGLPENLQFIDTFPFYTFICSANELPMFFHNFRDFSQYNLRLKRWFSTIFLLFSQPCFITKGVSHKHLGESIGFYMEWAWRPTMAPRTTSSSSKANYRWITFI